MDPKNPKDGDADPTADEVKREEIEIVSTKPGRKDSTMNRIGAIAVADLKEAGSRFRKLTEALRKGTREITGGFRKGTGKIAGGFRRLTNPTDKK